MAGVSRYGNMFSNQKYVGELGLTLRTCCVKTPLHLLIFFSSVEGPSHYVNTLQRRELRHTQDPTANKCMNPGNWILEIVLSMASVMDENIWTVIHKTE